VTDGQLYSVARTGTVIFVISYVVLVMLSVTVNCFERLKGFVIIEKIALLTFSLIP